jgi:GT2 family glycosyltransferase
MISRVAVLGDRRSPDIALVIPSRGRPVRLRWLLNALAEQSLPQERFEVVVAHDGENGTRELLAGHELGHSGVLRAVEPGGGHTNRGVKRNLGWRSTAAPLIAFTDDDCRPPSDWLERAVAACARHPGAIVQGATEPDPDEIGLEAASAHSRTQRITPPTPWAQTCNIVYPRAVLERLGGFDEELGTGEDAELAARARKARVEQVGAPEVLTYHAVHAELLPRHLLGLPGWGDLPALVKRHPELRRHFPLWIFWKRTHVWAPLAALGVALGRRRSPLAVLALPWLVHTLPQQYGHDPYGRLRALSELPSRALIDLTEIAVLARGSAKHRTLLL